MTANAIEVRDLVRTYKTKRTPEHRFGETVRALDGVTLDVPRGQLFGLLGPNGAGKTTLIKVLTTLLLPSEGSARVAGFDVAAEARKVRERMSMVSGGEHSGFGLLTVREQLWMFGQFYGLPGKASKARIDELLEMLGLAHASDRRVSALSTGMRQKMNMIRALLPDPDVLFLDEPTVGLDVAAARDIRGYITRWMAEKPGERTILLTTHYLHEADELCDRIAIITHGRIVACDTPAALRRRAAGGSYFALTTDHVESTAWLEAIPGVRRVDGTARDGRSELHLRLDDDEIIAAVVQALTEKGHRIFAFEKHEPSLEEAFVQIAGSRIEDADA